MKNPRRIFPARFLGVVLFLTTITGILPGQYFISIKTGLIQYIEGEVFLNNAPLRLPQKGWVQMEQG
jgi:hypothetical protein